MRDDEPLRSNSGPNSGGVTGSDSASFCQVGWAGEEAVAGLRLGAGGGGMVLTPCHPRSPEAVGD